jgi:murein DD-endopeptidase MepM/ murein hydrolase activator NlpD
LPERARDLPRRAGVPAIARLIAHVAVVCLLAASAAVGVAGAGRDQPAHGGLGFGVVSAVRGADDSLESLRSATFVIQPNPTDTDPVPERRIVPTSTPVPAPLSIPKPKPATAARVLAPAVALAPAPFTAVVGTGKLLWPVPGAIITQYFWAGHLAIDLATDAGNPVLAAAAGVVVSAGWRSNGGGLVIEIDHGNGLHTLYNHLGAILVSTGQVVGRGQRIGSVGCTGLCTGSHVHFQVKVGGVFVSPLRYL